MKPGLIAIAISGTIVLKALSLGALAQSVQSAAAPVAQSSKAGDQSTPSSTIPPAFSPLRGVVNNPLSTNSAQYMFQVDGRDWRAFQAFRFDENAHQYQRYYVWPVPQMMHNPKPIAGLPEYVFAAGEPDASGARDIKFEIELMSSEMRGNPGLIDAIWQQDQGFLKANAVTDKTQLQVSCFPVSHGFVEFYIGRTVFLVAQTGTITATPNAVGIWTALTPSQLQKLTDAMKAGTLEMTWQFQYSGTAPVLKADTQATMTAEMVTKATAKLSAAQRAGDIPLFDNRQRDEVAQSLLSEIRISTTANDPDGLLLVNIDAVLPQLFEHRVIAGQDLAAFLNDPAKNAALAQYLLPHLKKLEDEAATKHMTVKTETHTVTSGSEGGGSVSLPFVGLSFGSDDSSSDSLVKSFNETNGVVELKKSATSLYEPVKIEADFVKKFQGNTAQTISKKVYVTKDSNVHYFYVEDSPVAMGAVSIYDTLREKAQAASEVDDLSAKLAAAMRVKAHQEWTARNERWKSGVELSAGAFGSFNPSVPASGKLPWLIGEDQGAFISASVVEGNPKFSIACGELGVWARDIQTNPNSPNWFSKTPIVTIRSDDKTRETVTDIFVEYSDGNTRTFKPKNAAPNGDSVEFDGAITPRRMKVTCNDGTAYEIVFTSFPTQFAGAPAQAGSHPHNNIVLSGPPKFTIRGITPANLPEPSTPTAEELKAKHTIEELRQMLSSASK